MKSGPQSSEGLAEKRQLTRLHRDPRRVGGIRQQAYSLEKVTSDYTGMSAVVPIRQKRRDYSNPTTCFMSHSISNHSILLK